MPPWAFDADEQRPRIWRYRRAVGDEVIQDEGHALAGPNRHRKLPVHPDHSQTLRTGAGTEDGRWNRSRSLHVLAGGGAALVLYCVSAQLGAINPPSGTARDAITACQTIGVFAIPALGWIAAIATWRVRRYDGAVPTTDAAAAEAT